MLGAASYRRSDGYRHVRATYDGGRAGFFDLQAGWQDRDFGSNGFYAAYNPDQWEHTATALGSLRWLKTAGRFSLGAAASYRKNFDRYDWTRGTAMNRHNTDNVGAKLWADCDWAAGVTSLGADYAFNHIYSTNLGDKLSVPEGHYTHAKARHTGNLWLRHAKRWRRFDAAASAGVSLTPYGTSALWSLSAGWTPVEELRVGAGVWQSMRLPTFTDLYYTSPAQINNLDLTPEHAVTYRISADYLKHCWNISAQVYYRAGRDIIDWVWREDMGDKWHSEQSSRLDTFGAELAGGYASAEGFLRRVTLSYGYITTDRNADVIAKSAMDFMRHKAALAVEVHFLRRMSLALTASVYDRNGSYTHYPVAGTPPSPRSAATSLISCSTDVSSGRRASAASTSTPRTSPTRATATSAESACRVSGVRAGSADHRPLILSGPRTFVKRGSSRLQPRVRRIAPNPFCFLPDCREAGVRKGMMS